MQLRFLKRGGLDDFVVQGPAFFVTGMHENVALELDLYRGNSFYLFDHSNH